jgi:hypothetical protein
VGDTLSASKSIYIRRSITKKIMREGTGLRVDKMPDHAVWARLARHSNWLMTNLDHERLANPELTRAVLELSACVDELHMRGTQLGLQLYPR